MALSKEYHVVIIKPSKEAKADAITFLGLAENYAVEDLSPVSVGDVVEVNGFTFEGMEMLVERVELVGDDCEAFKAFGPILKADGMPSCNQGEWYSAGRVDNLVPGKIIRKSDLEEVGNE